VQQFARNAAVIQLAQQLLRFRQHLRACVYAEELAHVALLLHRDA